MSDDFQEVPSLVGNRLPVTDEADAVKAEPVKPKKKTEEKLLTAFYEMRGFCLCEDSSGNGYQVPSELCPSVIGEAFSVDMSDTRIQVLYDWDKEIKAMLPDQKTLTHNIRKALWRNGAVSKSSAKENQVQKNLMRGAFPYRIEIEEE